MENSSLKDEIMPPMTWSIDDVETWLLGQASSVAGGQMISPILDVFDQGFDR